MAEYTAAAETKSLDGQAQSWNETALLLIEGTAKLFTHWMIAFRDNTNIPTLWHELLDQLDHFLGRGSLCVSSITFLGLTEMLSEINPTSDLCRSLVPRCWRTWQDYSPVAHTDSPKSDANQDALLAYIECLRQLLRLKRDRAEPSSTKDTLLELRTCITGSRPSEYTSDVDSLTHVQRSVLELLKMIPTKVPESAYELLACITFFVSLAYNQATNLSGNKQTYVALSKASMSLLESFVSVHLEKSDMDLSKLLTESLNVLAEPINLKYKFDPLGKSPSPWRKATSTATAVLEVSSNLVKGLSPDERLDERFWHALVNIVDGIISADTDAADNISAILVDQDADIAAFSHIRTMIIPGLGSSSITESVRQSYAASLFKNSILHEPHPDDLAAPDDANILSGLQNIHNGRVQDLPPSPRSKVSYLLLDELFALVAIHNDDGTSSSPSSSERIALAQAAAPYLLLRCGLTLKAYICDQPLRGRLPQPWSQKEEMLHILRKLVELDSESVAINPPSSLSQWQQGQQQGKEQENDVREGRKGTVRTSSSQTKTHLQKLYPLILRALKVAGRDAEMAGKLRKVLGAMSDVQDV